MPMRGLSFRIQTFLRSSLISLRNILCFGLHHHNSKLFQARAFLPISHLQGLSAPAFFHRRLTSLPASFYSAALQKMSTEKSKMRSTTVLHVRRNGHVALAGDGK